MGTAGVGTAGVGTAGVGTAGVGTAGVGTAGVGTAGVGTAEVGTAEVGTETRLPIAPSPASITIILEKDRGTCNHLSLQKILVLNDGHAVIQPIEKD